MTLNRLFVAGTAILAGLVAFSPKASASYVTFTGNAGGFVPNTATPAYLTAQGAPTEFLSFNTDSSGNPVTIANPNGGIFSHNVVFSSVVSPTFGGVASADVELGNPNGPDSEIGPNQSFGGILDINFLALGHAVTAVGFGPVQLQDATGAIRIYDQNNVLVMTVSPAAFPEFDFFGIVGNAGSEIGRIQLDGSFFAIQDFQYSGLTGAGTPEPGTMLLLGCGLLSLGFARRAQQSRKS